VEHRATFELAIEAIEELVVQHRTFDCLKVEGDETCLAVPLGRQARSSSHRSEHSINRVNRGGGIDLSPCLSADIG